MKAVKIMLTAVLILAVGVVGLYMSGYLPSAIIWTITAVAGPDRPFDPKAAVAPPDYNLAESWAALPDSTDPADLIPEGIEDEDIQGRAPVDAFFIHPTGFLHGFSWTSPMDVDSGTEENTAWMMANQASAFNGCCNVYAPRYREASIYAYIGASEEERDRVLELAYSDVVRSFEYYLKEHNAGRPLIIASHSQGTHHAMRLLKERISGTPLKDRLVAAYIVGSVMIKVSETYFETMGDIGPCTGPDDLGCVVHWDTYGDGAEVIASSSEEKSLCTNPITWRVDEQLADASLHLGAVPVSGPFNMKFFGDDVPVGFHHVKLEAPIAGHTWAQCRDGSLYVADQKDTVFEGMAFGGSKNYHGLDYSLFHTDIRENAKHRVRTFLSANVGSQS